MNKVDTIENTGQSMRKFLASVNESGNGKVGRTDGYKASFATFYVEDGYNVKDIRPEQVDNFAHAYRNGHFVPALDCETVLVNGEPRLKIIDGHHRYFGAEKVVNEGIELTLLFNIFSGNDGDKVFHMITSSQGGALTVLERAHAYNRLKGYGYTNGEIAKRLNVTDAQVSNALLLCRADKKTQNYVRDGRISASRVINLLRDYGSIDKAAIAVRVEVGDVPDEADISEQQGSGQIGSTEPCQEGQEDNKGEHSSLSENHNDEQQAPNTHNEDKKAGKPKKITLKKKKPTAKMVSEMGGYLSLIGDKLNDKMLDAEADDESDVIDFSIQRDDAMKILSMLGELDSISQHNKSVEEQLLLISQAEKNPAGSETDGDSVNQPN